MKVVVPKTAIQEAELLSRLSYDGLWSAEEAIPIWNQIMRYNDEEGKERRKQLRKEGIIKKRTIETRFGRKILFMLTVSGTPQSNERIGQHHAVSVACKVQPLTQGTPYIASLTQRSWNTMASKVGLPTITSVGGSRLTKLRARFKECFGKPESIWAEVVDGVESSVRKYQALAKSSWLSYDYVIRSQETFDKARQGRIALYSDKGKSEAEEHMPSYLGGKR